jgi:molecular chaperone DnaK
MALKNGVTAELPLSKAGENTFKLFVFDGAGGPVTLGNNRVVIARTAASIDAIPASASVGIEVLEKLGGRSVLDFLVRGNDTLPTKGKKVFKAAESLRAGAPHSLNFKIWEGDIADPVSDNRLVGAMQIRGSDFEVGAIAAGDDLVCEYEVLDSGNIVLDVSVPSIGASFHSGRNFYSRQAGAIDYSDANKQVAEEAGRLRERLDHVADKVDDERLEKASEYLNQADELDSENGDPESTKQAMDRVLEVKKLLAQVKKEHGAVIRQMELDSCTEFFNENVRQHARPTEASAFDNLARTAQRAVDKKTTEFESLLDELRGKNFEILWRQDWFVSARFEAMTQEPWMFADRDEHAKLVQAGKAALQADDFDKLRSIVGLLHSLRVDAGQGDDLLVSANIVRS